MTTYKVFFHVGEELGLKTRVEKGNAALDESSLRVDGPTGLVVPLKDITAVKLFRLHGLGRVVQIDHRHGRLYLTVVRFMIGQFATINFAKTGKLHALLAATTDNVASN